MTAPATPPPELPPAAEPLLPPFPLALLPLPPLLLPFPLLTLTEPALLDAEHHPEIVLRALRLEPPAGGTTPAGGAAAESASAPSDGVRAWVESTVRGQVRSFAVPVRYRLADGELQAAGEFPLKQSELGLTPFSALLGALQVQDEMQVSFKVVARAAAVNPVSPSPTGAGAPPPR